MRLQTVGFAHVRHRVRFHRAFESADLHNLHLNPHFVEQTFEKRYARSQTTQVDTTDRVKINLVGSRGDIIITLRIIVGICHNPFARFAEISHSLADSFRCGDTCRCTVAGNVKPCYIVVILCCSQC